MINKIKKIFVWNTTESILYHGILLVHQMLLYSILPKKEYGLYGIIFSSLYLITKIVNLGLDASIAPFFKNLTSKKTYIKSIIYQNITPSLLIFIIIGIISIIYRDHLPFMLSPLLLFVIAGIIFFETTKKTLRTFLQLSLNLKKTTFSEIKGIIIYILMVWASYGLYSSISAYTIFVPLLISSFIQTATLSYFFLQWYHSLPDNEDEYPKELLIKMYKSRVSCFLYQMGSVIISGNFIVPLFGTLFGAAQAAPLKFVTNIIHNISGIFHKIFGTSSSIVFAHTKQHDKIAQKNMLSYIFSRLYRSIGVMIILSISLIVLYVPHQNQPLPIVILFIYSIMQIIENMCIPLEKFIITHEHSNHLVAINCATIGILFLIFRLKSALTPVSLLIALLGVRTITLIIFSIIVQTRCNNIFCAKKPFL